MKFAVLLTIGLVFAVPALSGAQDTAPQAPEKAAENDAAGLAKDIAGLAKEVAGLTGDISGIYDCEGVNPDGTPYKGIVGITKVGETFLVQWILEDGSSVVGVGILKGDVFAVSYFGGAPAVIVYKVDGNRLVGEWTMLGDGKFEGRLFSETLTKVEGDHPLFIVPSDPDPTPSPQREPESKPKPSFWLGIQL